jgi:bifunctional DNA-binding transcriptional regulator/antitoxin component of YhaV-PrlF toxin-antitoxin module
MALLTEEISVGKNGEILLKPDVSAKLGLSPGDTLFVEVSSEKLIVQKIHPIDEIIQGS